MSPSHGLRLRLLLLGVAILLPILALLAYQSWYYTQRQIDDERSRAGHLATLVAHDAQLQFTLHQKLLETVAQSPDISAAVDAATCRKLLSSADRIHESLSDLALYAPDGRRICATDAATTADFGIAEQGYFKEALRLKKPTTSDVTWSAAARRAMRRSSSPSRF